MTQTKIVTVSLSEKTHIYEIVIGTNQLSALGEFSRQRVDRNARRVCVVSNKKVFSIYGATVAQSLKNDGFEVSVYLMPDGERHKNLRVLEKVLAFFSESKLTRSDLVVALGGGVVGDLAGFAAAVFQRGVPFIQVPTTLLAQIDSSVGGKTAVNSAFGKNLIGAFYQPHGVLIDAATLKTLPKRELVAGFCEAVKHGAICSRRLFDQTAEFLQKHQLKRFSNNFENANFLTALQNLIAANIAFKAEIVKGDERENVNREDARSRRILNFGHTVGHALEKVTAYKRFKHGEAVGLGMIAAAQISKRLGKLTENELNLFCGVVSSVGTLPKADDIAPESIISAFSHDKKAVSDSFKWILLETIGQAAIVDNKNIPEQIVREAVRSALNTK
jgi:3-dehydroquinate synthase